MGINIGRSSAYDSENPADELATYVVRNQRRIFTFCLLFLIASFQLCIMFHRGHSAHCNNDFILLSDR